MDEQTEGFLKLFGYLLIAPFWITWKVGQFAWQLVVKPAIETSNHRRAQEHATHVRPVGQAVVPPTASPSAKEMGIFAAIIIFAMSGVAAALISFGIATSDTGVLATGVAFALVVIAYFVRAFATGSKSDLNQSKSTPIDAQEDPRATQLAALKAAVPPGLPERMRATIQTNEFRQPRQKQQRISHMIGEDSFVYVEDGETTMYAVDMVLQMTEAERAIIKQHQLDDIILEDVPMYSEDQIVQARIDDRARAEAAKDPLLKALQNQSLAFVDETRKHQRRKTRIGDLVVSPFSRAFESPHEADDYAHRLKTEFLPKIRQLLDRYRDYKQTETIEL